MLLFLRKGSLAKVRCLLAMLLTMVVGVWLTACSPNENNAKACFHPELFQAGNRMSYEAYLENDPVATRYPITTVINDQTRWRDQLVWPIVSTHEKGDIKVKLTVYNRLDESDYARIKLGHTVTLGGFEQHPAKHYFRPPAHFSYQLTTGKSAAQQYESLTTARPNHVQRVSTDEQFVGMESVTVPAGTFETCHFATHTVVMDGEDEIQRTHSDIWFAKVNGMTVKVVSHQASDAADKDPTHKPEQQTAPSAANKIRELVTAHINGRAFPAN